MANFSRTFFWSAAATATKLLTLLIIVKFIAQHFGAAGLGQAANYMQLLTVLGVLSGAGLLNGVTQSVAQYREQPTERTTLLASASFIIAIFSLFLTAVLSLFARPIADFIFQDPNQAPIIYCLALLQLAMAIGNYFLAILKGLRAAREFALASIGANLLGLGGFALLLWFGNFQSALIGMAFISASAGFTAYIMLKTAVQKKPDFQFAQLKPQLNSQWHAASVKKLSQFMLITLVSACCIPLIYMLLRNQLAQHFDSVQVGLWQGVSKVSDAYLQFVILLFSLYFLPHFSQLKTAFELKTAVQKSLVLVMSLTALLSCAVYFARPWIIQLLFGADFAAMDDLFLWQCCGDILRMGCYVFGYLLIAKVAVKLYIVAELAQAALLWTFCRTLLLEQGAQGAVQGYFYANLILFSLCLVGFYCYQKRNR